MHWDWGNVPAWIAALVALVALVRAWWTGRTAKAARDRAVEAHAIAKSNRDAFDRIADAQQRRAAATERAIAQAAERSDPPPIPPPPTVEFLLEYRGGTQFALRNIGTGRATGVTVDPDFTASIASRPSGVDLRPMEAVEFVVAPSTFDRSAPTELEVTWNEAPGSALVSVPPRR